MLVALIAAMYCTTKIPLTAIKQNLTTSQEKLAEIPVRHPILGMYIGSIWDTTADATTLNIIANHDGSMRSMLLSAYYEDKQYSYPENLGLTLDGREANTPYARYWHGATMLYRPLLLLFDISGIRLFLLGVYVLLQIVFFMACKKAEKTELFAFSFIAQLLMAIPCLFCSMETAPVVLIMSLGQILLLRTKEENQWVLFALMGLLTAFFDFLTVETITLTVPLLMQIYLDWRKKTSWKPYIKSAMAWGIAYAATFLAKVPMTVLLCGKEAYEGTSDRLSMWFTGAFKQAYSMTLFALFPLSGSVKAALITMIIMLLLVILAFWFFRAQKVDYQYLLLVLSVNLIPLARFLVLNGHAAEHYYFVPRMFITVPMSIAIVMYTQSVFTEERKKVSHVRKRDIRHTAMSK